MRANLTLWELAALSMNSAHAGTPGLPKMDPTGADDCLNVGSPIEEYYIGHLYAGRLIF